MVCVLPAKCTLWRKMLELYTYEILDIAYSRYQLLISIFYLEVPGYAGRVTSASVVQCMYMHTCPHVDGTLWHRLILDDSVNSLAELNNEIKRWRTKKNLAFWVAISEIHAVLAVLCEMHVCMRRSAGCGQTESEHPSRNFPHVDIDSWYHPRYRPYTICRIVWVWIGCQVCISWWNHTCA